ncbi:Proteasome subunit [Operophtera brumata]|uniref:Proteasome subunit n=1 Tax=Operophtera brumata TaxID=104452 RepID=A0A0L7LPL3_OPEBR|nr:Proteasome subunit [Operophtera brumata]
MMDSAMKVQEYKEALKLRAELLITKQFPDKIVKLNELLEISHFQRELADIHQSLSIPVPQSASEHSSAKRRREEPTEVITTIQGFKMHILPSGSVKCNSSITSLVRLL